MTRLTSKADDVLTVVSVRARPLGPAVHLVENPLPSEQIAVKSSLQYTLSDFAAIGLNDPHDRATLRLRAAGPSSYIIPHDLGMSEAAKLNVCPATFMLHVARTGQEITTPMLSTLRHEPFYGTKYPRSIIALPILNQGNQVGVILLSSTSSISSATQWASARGIVGCLATFASIVIFNNSFTKRLKQEVEERTRDLTSALAAKTQFLSQCSHELRTPLSSILVHTTH